MKIEIVGNKHLIFAVVFPAAAKNLFTRNDDSLAGSAHDFKFNFNGSSQCAAKFTSQ